VHERIDQALARGIISADEARQLQDFDTAVLAITAVDDFDPAELRRVGSSRVLAPHDTAGLVG
jgi:phage tail tape-measure protein